MSLATTPSDDNATSPSELVKDRVFHRVAIDLEQLFHGALGIELLLVGLTALGTVDLVLAGMRLDVRDGQAERFRVRAGTTRR